MRYVPSGRVKLSLQGIVVKFTAAIFFRTMNWSAQGQKKRCMSRVRKRKKLNSIQLFTFTHAAHTTFIFYLRT